MTGLLLSTSNGIGMGHLTRQVAVARALGPSDQATLFSLSLGLPLATSMGIPGEYCPSYDRPWIASGDWHNYLRDRIVAIVEETGADAFLFDGVAPYPGIGMASEMLREVAFIWLRRGMWRPGTGAQHLRKARYFDLLIEPGDLGASHDRGLTRGRDDAVEVGPISILETTELLPRDQARAKLGLPDEVPVALLTLGSGRLGEIAGPGRTALETLLDHPDGWHVALTRSPVAINEVVFESADRIHEISGLYPLATYVGAFDAAVSSAGYNAVHELVPAGVPTLLVANTSTTTDDQMARAQGVAAAKQALFAQDRDLVGLNETLSRLLDPAVRSDLAAAAGATRSRLTGASETADVATEFARSFTRRPRTARALIHGTMESGKATLRRSLGEERTERLKRLLGRQPSPVHKKAKVRLSADGDPGVPELAVVSDLTIEQASSGGPIEHVLHGSSRGYRDRRNEMIERYYEVVS